jgi:hypothetical protein
MATKKKSGRSPSAARGFAVVVEEMRSQFKVFGEALQGLCERVDAGFAQVDVRFAQVDARFAQVDARFGQVDTRFGQVDREIGLLKTAVLENGRDIRDVRNTLSRVEVALEKKVDREEVESIVERVIARR